MIKHINKARMTGEITITIDIDDDYIEESVEIPIRFEVCSRCHGRGKHVNPSVDGDGITRDMFDEDPDFEEAYFAGEYDVTCEECGGDNIEAHPDEDRMDEDQKAAWAKYCQEAHDRYLYRLECEAERRFGA
jgi:hypothetical protein